MGTASCQLGCSMDWQLCRQRLCGGPTVLLLELHFKVSGEKRKSYTPTETTLVWHLYMTAHLSPILTRKILKLATTLQNFRLKKKKKKRRKKKSHMRWKKRCYSGVYTWPHISHTPWHEKCVGLLTFVSFEIVARVSLHTFAGNKVDSDQVLDANDYKWHQTESHGLLTMIVLEFRAGGYVDINSFLKTPSFCRRGSFSMYFFPGSRSNSNFLHVGGVLLLSRAT